MDYQSVQQPHFAMRGHQWFLNEHGLIGSFSTQHPGVLSHQPIDQARVYIHSHELHRQRLRHERGRDGEEPIDMGIFPCSRSSGGAYMSRYELGSIV